MTIQFVDSFEASSSLVEKGWVATAGTSASSGYTTSFHRTGSRCLSFTPGYYGSQTYVARPIGANEISPRQAFGFQLSALSAAVGLCAFRDSGTDQVSLRVNTDGTLSACRGSASGTLLGTTTATVVAGVWYHAELAATIDGSAGSVALYLNGTLVLSLSGINTKASSNAYATHLLIGSNATIAGSQPFYLDDYIFADSSGGQGQIGAAVVLASGPSGAGSHTDWAPSAGANYTDVDEAPANGDTDYVSDGTSGHIDTYAMADISPTSGVVLAVAVNVVARDDAGGSPPIATMIRSGSTEAVGASVATGSTYLNAQSVYPNDPATGAAWTISAVNGVEAGVKRL